MKATKRRKRLNEGTKFDHGKPRMELLPLRAIEGLARVMTVGAIKYNDRNWERGIKWSRVFGATLRHLFAYWLGQDHDPETGLPHIDHALCNVGFLAEYFQTRKEFDDRPKLSRNKHLTQTQRVHKS